MEADVNPTEGKTRSALMEATLWNHADCIDELIEAGADVNFRDPDGKSALMDAAAGGRVTLTGLAITIGKHG